jgi:apolipoprotein N-acyltransferase
VQRRPVFLIAVVLVLGGGEALRHVAWTERAGEPFKAALVQGNVEQEMKFRPERAPAIFETYARFAESAQAKLIVFPETALPVFFERIAPAYLARLEAAARENRGDLLVGVPFRDGRDYYNSVVSLGVSPRQVYHKVHLVPFGEFVPPGFRWTLELMSIPLSDFSRGAATQAPLRVAGQRVAVNVCYEDVFGAEIAQSLPEATLLVNMSNVAWFGDSLAPAQHLGIARMRAIETGRMHLTATNTGITAAIAADGKMLARLPQFAAGKLEIEVRGRTGATPYVALVDGPALALSALLLFFFAARRRSG